METSGHTRHVSLLLALGHVIHVAHCADLVIRIPGGGQPKDGFYRLDYRYVLQLKYFLKYFRQPSYNNVSLSSFATKKNVSCF